MPLLQPLFSSKKICIVIVIEGGLVSAVATIKDKLKYRIVDFDVTRVQDPEDSGIIDQE